MEISFRIIFGPGWSVTEELVEGGREEQQVGAVLLAFPIELPSKVIVI
jgi:hypothetical protein